MFDEAGEVRPLYAELAAWLKFTPVELLRLRSEEAEAIFRRLGITFAVYGEGGDPERLIPFDVLPRLVAAEEWRFWREDWSKGFGPSTLFSQMFTIIRKF